MPPSTTHWQWSQPLENDQRPLRRNPPSARSTVPVGASEVESWMLSSLPHTSSWACGGNSARCQLWAPMTAKIQPVEPHAAPTSVTAW
jgi:hypothetical protein